MIITKPVLATVVVVICEPRGLSNPITMGIKTSKASLVEKGSNGRTAKEGLVWARSTEARRDAATTNGYEFLWKHADAMRMMRWWNAWHEQNAKQKTKTQPRRKISYRISGKGKNWSYEYGKLYPGHYNTPPLWEDLVLRSMMAPEGKGRGR